MSEEAKKGMLDWEGEEEEEDDGADFENVQPASSASAGNAQRAAPAAASNASGPLSGLMEFDEDDEDDDQDALLKAADTHKKKKKLKKSKEDDDDEDGELDNSVEDQSPVIREKKRKTRSPESYQQVSDGSISEIEAEEDYRDNESEAEERINNLMLPSLDYVVPKLDSKMYHVQLPRFLFVAGGAFDEDRYNFEREKEQIKARNGDELIGDEIVRWRVKRDSQGNVEFDESNQPMFESNTRIVEYDDGTFQIFVGEEALDLKITPTSNEFLHARVVEGEDRSAYSGVASFQGIGVVLPTGPNSKQTRALQALIKRQQVRTVAMKTVVTTFDPEKELDNKIKQVDQEYRKSLRARRTATKRRKTNATDFDERYLEQAVRKPRKTKRNEDDEEEDFIDDDEEEMDEEELVSGDDESSGEGDDEI